MEPNHLIEKMLTENPLIGFSVYTDIQCKTVQILGQEIIQCLEAGIAADAGDGQGARCDAQVLNRGYGLFWLWVLGAYEVVRTMCQAEQCFSSQVARQLKDLKRNLALLRIPFAKQELPGKSVPMRGEPSIYGIGHSPPDLQYQINSKVFSARDMIVQFGAVFSGISRSDVIADHRTVYCSDRSS